MPECCAPQQPDRGVLQDYDWVLPRIYTVTCPIQHLLREDHAGRPEDHCTSISIGGRHICCLKFAKDIDLLCGTNQEQEDFTDKRVTSTVVYSIEVSTEKSVVIVNSANNCSADIHMNIQKLEEVDKFKYLGSTLSKDGSTSAEVHTRIDRSVSSNGCLDRVRKTIRSASLQNSGCTNRFNSFHSVRPTI